MARGAVAASLSSNPSTPEYKTGIVTEGNCSRVSRIGSPHPSPSGGFASLRPPRPRNLARRLCRRIPIDLDLSSTAAPPPHRKRCSVTAAKFTTQQNNSLKCHHSTTTSHRSARRWKEKPETDHLAPVTVRPFAVRSDGWLPRCHRALARPYAGFLVSSERLRCPVCRRRPVPFDFLRHGAILCLSHCLRVSESSRVPNFHRANNPSHVYFGISFATRCPRRPPPSSRGEDQKV